MGTTLIICVYYAGLSLSIFKVSLSLLGFMRIYMYNFTSGHDLCLIGFMNIRYSNNIIDFLSLVFTYNASILTKM